MFSRRIFLEMSLALVGLASKPAEPQKTFDQMLEAFNGPVGWVRAFNNLLDILHEPRHPAVVDLDWRKRVLASIDECRRRLTIATDLHQKLLNLITNYVKEI